MAMGWPCCEAQGWTLDSLDVELAATSWIPSAREASHALGGFFGQFHARAWAVLVAAGRGSGGLAGIGGRLCQGWHLRAYCRGDTNSHQLSSGLINFHQLSSGLINSYQLSSTFINSHQLLSTFINLYQLSSTFIDFHRLSSTLTDSHELS